MVGQRSGPNWTLLRLRAQWLGPLFERVARVVAASERTAGAMAGVQRVDVLRTGLETDVLEVMPLGAGCEVGRSCCIVKFKGKTVLFDCGVHPAYSGLASLPFFDAIEPDQIDLALITHFHLDHCAGLPYLLERTNFNPKARIFMTHPTKAIYKALLSDFVRVSHSGGSTNANAALYNEQDIDRTMDRIETVDYHQEMNIAGIRFWAYNAGHVLGAAMFLIEIAGVRVLYTGDFSRLEDRHLKEAELPPFETDVLIVESTYGTQVHEPRKIRESRFTQKVAQIVRRGGRCLLPVFALGRAQELLLILDEFWEAHPDLQHVPIYYASALAKRCMSVYLTYINMMNDSVRKRYDVSNPFAFKFVSNLKSIEHFSDTGPCVVMASPGMLQSGLSRQLCERWCTDKRNGILLCGYAVDGTLAKHIMTEPASITRQDGKEVPLRCSVDYITFSAHSDFIQTKGFIEALRPSNIILVHGQVDEMGRLRAALEAEFNKQASVTALKNAEAFISAPLSLNAGGDVAQVPMTSTADPLATGEKPQSDPLTTIAMSAVDGALGGLGYITPAGAKDPLLSSGHPVDHPLRDIRIFCPKNTETVPLEFRGEKVGKAISVLPKRKLETGMSVSGMMIRQDFHHTLLKPSDLHRYTNIKVSRIGQRQVVPLTGTWEALKLHLCSLFETVEELDGNDGCRPGLLLANRNIILTCVPEKSQSAVETSQGPSTSAFGPQAHVIIEWRANYATDMIVESVASMCVNGSLENDKIHRAVGIDKIPVLRTSEKNDSRQVLPSNALGITDADLNQTLEITRKMLAQVFGPLLVNEDHDKKSKLVVDFFDVEIDHDSGMVACEDPKVRDRVWMALRRIHSVVYPIPDYYCDCCDCGE
ncbi:Cleavage and polyadenylation specificity factor subunit 3 [Porphyridium purpureum]|uniref:Cleavage and polyadenylation specificity factor subunit 3 n=1 Tax=Porphyridium purpureum TaxID=35688 RepID=A0A5J4YGD1_PORPP|nr:Cleavage and polyadenylation specificity factor subunit 3 [Porphyridium purpureum]|eukprot:POR5472..scf225_25